MQIHLQRLQSWLSLAPVSGSTSAARPNTDQGLAPISGETRPSNSVLDPASASSSSTIPPPPPCNPRGNLSSAPVSGSTSAARPDTDQGLGQISGETRPSNSVIDPASASSSSTIPPPPPCNPSGNRRTQSQAARLWNFLVGVHKDPTALERYTNRSGTVQKALMLKAFEETEGIAAKKTRNYLQRRFTWEQVVSAAGLGAATTPPIHTICTIPCRTMRAPPASGGYCEPSSGATTPHVHTISRNTMREPPASGGDCEPTSGAVPESVSIPEIPPLPLRLQRGCPVTQSKAALLWRFLVKEHITSHDKFRAKNGTLKGAPYLREFQKVHGISFDAAKGYVTGNKKRFTWKQVLSAAQLEPATSPPLHTLAFDSCDYERLTRREDGAGQGGDSDGSDEGDGDLVHNLLTRQ